MGMGQFMGRMGGHVDDFARSLDDRLVNQAEQRANEARLRAIDAIKADMDRHPTAGATKEMMAGYDNSLAAAEAQMAGHMGPLETINRAMSDNPYARYGVIGSAAVGGGAAMTAGAQKLLSVMGLLEEANQTEVARDMPLQS